MKLLSQQLSQLIDEVCNKIKKIKEKNERTKIIKRVESNSSLTNLNISNREFNEDEVKRLAKAIKNHPEIEVLNASDNNFSLTSFKIFTGAIKDNKIIKTLNFSHTSLNSSHFPPSEIVLEAMKYLIDAIKDNSSIEVLDISWIPLSMKSAEILGDLLEVNKTIKTLSLVSSRINQEIMQSLSKKIIKNPYSSLTCLDVSGNFFKDDALIPLEELITAKPKIVRLNTAFNSLTSDGAQTLSKILENGNLTYLNLSDNRLFFDDKLKPFWGKIGRSETLTELDICCNNLCDEGVASIGSVLKNNNSLTKINISWNGVSISGIKSLFNSLTKNKNKLTEIKIHNRWDNDNNENNVVVSLANTLLDNKNCCIEKIGFVKKEDQSYFRNNLSETGKKMLRDVNNKLTLNQAGNRCKRYFFFNNRNIVKQFICGKEKNPFRDVTFKFADSEASSKLCQFKK